MDKAYDLINRMENEGLLPNIITYNVVLDEFCRLGQIQEANMIYKKMAA